jgi:hypothetical protein
MPWCPQCERFLSPPTVAADGTCPTCGRPVDPGRAHHAAPAEEESPPVPWHLKALLAAVALYLGWRAWQGIEWVVQRFAG